MRIVPLMGLERITHIFLISAPLVLCYLAGGRKHFRVTDSVACECVFE